MITPRRTRLVRVADLHEFRRAIRGLALKVPGTLVLVPTRSAARQVTRSMPVSATSVVTRDELYDTLLVRLHDQPRWLTPFERDGMMQAAAATVPDPPFRIRPGLIAEMLRFYDQLRRQSQDVKRFHELMEAALGGGDADMDRGVERLLGQTRFLAATFRGYEQRVAASDGCDEHTLRARLLESTDDLTIRHIVVTVPDWIADPAGLFVADFDLLARLPRLERLDIVCTEAVLGSGFHERLHGWWPGIEEQDGLDPAGPPPARVRPTLATPADAPPDQPWFTYRDREEELIAIARRVMVDALAPDRVAVVFKQPLPYLYLAADTLGAAGIPFQSSDTLPLAAEPTCAVVDLVLDVAEANFTRPSLLALLRTPHLQLMDEDARASLPALDRALSEARYLGELPRLEALVLRDAAAPALAVARTVARDLAPLVEPAPASHLIRHLQTLLEKSFRPIVEDEPFAARERRARAALAETLSGLADAHAAHHDPVWSIEELTGAVRRWIGERTFEPQSGASGVQFLDDQAARYADVEEMTIVGLVENEWPERPRRSIFYPTSLLKALGWPSERDRRSADEARFLDLLTSASSRVALSTVTLDDEALVTRSILLDEVPRARLAMVADVKAGSGAEAPRYVPSPHHPITTSPHHPVTPSSHLEDPAFHGSLGPQPPHTWSVSALETYLDCPFKFYAQHILRLKEEPEEEEVMDPRRQGQFVHEVFEAFFKVWQAEGHRAITPENLDVARHRFADVVESAVARLPHAEAGLERTRLLGSSAAAGLGEAVLRMEAERSVAVVERLLEHRFGTTLTIETAEGPRTVSLKGKADRLDLLADGTFRLIDYKLGWPPARSRALQLPIYGLAAEQQLSAERRTPWVLGEAVYLAFKGPKRVVPLFTSPEERDEVLAKAQQRAADTLDAIERGEYPPHPDDVYRCDTCSYAAVCRKDYVGDV